MSFGVTNEGFVKKTLVDIKAELEQTFRTEFGVTIDLSADQPIGQIIGIFAKALADMWDLMEEIYTSRNVNEATGASLDNILAEVGITRIDAAATQVTDVLLWGDYGTLILAGKKASISAINKTFELQANVTIDNATIRGVMLSVDAPTGAGQTYSLTIDGDVLTYTSVGGDDEDDVIAGLTAYAGAHDYSGWLTSPESGVLRVVNVLKSDFNLSGVTANMTVDMYANAGIFTCTETGPISCPTYALDSITTPVTGWLEVENPFVGNTGRNEESDVEMRLRHNSYYSVGKGTEDAIAQSILNEVDGIISVKVISNRTDVEADGMPPHSLQVICEGGDPTEICQVIWDTAPAGIAIYYNPSSNETAYITDEEGYSHLIGYSKPDNVEIYVKVLYSLYDEETFPFDGVARIKQAIYDWAQIEYQAGKDVYAKRIYQPIYSVPGIGDLTVYVGTSYPANQSTLTMTDSQIANVALDRIEVSEAP